MEHKNRPPEWYSHNVPPEHHHPHNEWLVDRCSDQCDDQLPLFSRVGRGLQGNGYKVEVEQPSDCETYLHGYIYDSATGTYISDWQSHNVNGGHLSYQYHLHPYGDPPTFTITFKYDRPCYDDEHDMSWEWTTPAIPYIVEAGGSGIGNLFIKPTTGASWTAVRAAVASSDLPDSIADTLAAYEKLVFPEGDTRESLNPPLPGDDWTVNLEYGIGGDIDAPNIDDLAKIIGVTPDFLRRLVDERDVPTTPTFGNKANGDPINVKEYIDNGDATTLQSAKNYADAGDTATLNSALTHLHKDLFGGTSGTGSDYSRIPNDLKPLLGDSSGQATVWDWIEYAINQAAADATTKANNAKSDAIASANTHLHKDLYGAGVSGHDYTTEITNLGLMPLGGDSGTKSVWDWIKHAIQTAKDYADEVGGNIITKIIAPKMTTKSVSGRIAFYDLRKKSDNTKDSPQKGAEAKDDRMIPNRLATLQGGLQSITATAKISYFDTVPNVYITIEIDDTSGNDHSMFPSQVGVFEVNVNNSWVPLDITIAQSIGGVSLPGLPYPKLQAETLCNAGYLPPSTSPSNTGNFQVYAGIGNIKAAKKNINGSDADERSYGGWPWAEAAASNSPAYIYLINRYVAYGDETCFVSIDYARDYHTSYLRTGSNS